jgi:hypothetical protein
MNLRVARVVVAMVVTASGGINGDKVSKNQVEHLEFEVYLIYYNCGT